MKPIYDQNTLRQKKIIKLRTDVNLLLKWFKELDSGVSIGEIASELKDLIDEVSKLRTNIKRLDLAMGGYKDLAKRLKLLETICERQKTVKTLKTPAKKPFNWKKFVIKLLEK